MRACATEGCDNVVTPNRRGRPAIYCPTCRPRRRVPVTVEIDHPEHSPDGRPPQRVWTVRLRRGEQTVVIAEGLGWPTANALAHQLNNLLVDGSRRPSADGEALAVTPQHQRRRP